MPRNPCIEDLTSIFKKFGRVRSAYQIKDKFKRLQDYGFVDFIHVADAKKLLKLGSINIDGRLICFSPYRKAKTKEAQSSENNNNNSQTQQESYPARPLSNSHEVKTGYHYYDPRPQMSNYKQESKEKMHMGIEDHHSNKVDYKKDYQQFKRNKQIELYYKQGDNQNQGKNNRGKQTFLRNGRAKFFFEEDQHAQNTSN